MKLQKIKFYLVLAAFFKMSIVYMSSGHVYTSLDMPRPLSVKPGSLDLAFAGSGRTIFFIDGTTVNSANDIAIDRFGRIVVAGETTVGSEARFTLLRLNPDGTLDLSFGSGGYVIADIVTSNTLSNYANAIAIDDQNRILAAGVYNLDPAIVRYTEDGVLDTTFGADGVTTTSISNNNYIEDIALDSQGRIVAVGYSTSNANDILVLRYDKDGGLDSTFGTSNGYTIISVGVTAETTYALALDSSDRIIVAGARSGNMLVARLTADGLLDTTFGTSGYSILSTTNPVETLYSVKIDSQGKIVVAGVVNDTTTSPHVYGFFVARLLSTGAFDTTFNSVGYGRYGFSGYTTADKGILALDPFGRIVVMGSQLLSSGPVYKFVVTRILPNGQLDTAFGTDDNPGMSTVFHMSDAYVQAGVLDYQGRIVMAGYSDDNFFFSRFTSDYSIDYYRKEFVSKSLGFLG